MMTIFCSFNLSSGSCWLWIPRKDRRTCFTKRCVLIFFKISPLRAFTLSKIFSLDRGEFFFVAKQFSTYTCTHVPLKMALNQWCNFESNLWLACRKQCVLSLFYFFSDHSKGFGGKYGVQTDRVDKVNLLNIFLLEWNPL